MKIKSLELVNFKVFKSELFEFDKITILAGANSAGKSTVLNALSAIIQGSAARPFPFYFSNYGENVHLGGFKDIVHGGASNSKFGVGVTLAVGREEVYAKGRYRYASSGKQTLVDEICIKDKENELNIKWAGQNKGYKISRAVSEDSSKKEDKVFRMLLSSVSEIVSTAEEGGVEKNEIYDMFEKLKKSTAGFVPLEMHRGKDLYQSTIQEFPYRWALERFKKHFLDFIEKTVYVGPIRPYPSRHYFLSSYQNKVDALGGKAFELLIDWYKSDTKKFKKIAADLKLLKLAEDINPESIKDELIELNVTPFGQSKKVNLSDVGFGLSQILPVLVGVAATEKNGTLLINQPEVHLHPSSQALLADYFVAESKEKNFIIETHSEYLINRLRLLVAKGKISPSDIKIIYIDSQDGDTKISDIKINKNGALAGAPKTFFETYYIDSSELVFASIR